MYIKKVLNNGLTVVCEKIPYVKSVSIGIWAGAGSRLETPQTSGISHFSEHMLFKGTNRRAAQDIAEETDFLGGNLNAFTSRECTCLYAKVIDSLLEKTIDILSDMYINSCYLESDIETEKRVIFEEINMYEDSPEDIALDMLAAKAWRGSSLGYMVLGDEKNVASFTSADLKSFAASYYTAQNTVISVAGSFDEDKLFPMLEKYFADLPEGTRKTKFGKADFYGGRAEREKEIEQAHMAFGFEGAGSGEEDAFAEAVLCNILGGCVSSRLFRKIREERGLAYSVYSAPEAYQGAGMLYIYAGLSPENTKLVREIILNETQDLLKNGVSDYELLKGREQLKGSYVLGLENVSAIMNVMGKNTLLSEKVRTPEETIAGIDAVDNDKMNKVIKRIFGSEMAEITVTPKG